MAAVNADVNASASVQRGKLIIRNRRQFDQQIAQFKEGAEVEIEVTIRRATRSQQANAFNWSVVVHVISEHTGYTPDEVHEFLKMKFIPKKLAVCKGNGEIAGEFVLGGSTRKMNTLEFMDYVNDIKTWASQELDCFIPDPGDVGYGHGV